MDQIIESFLTYYPSAASTVIAVVLTSLWFKVRHSHDCIHRIEDTVKEFKDDIDDETKEHEGKRKTIYERIGALESAVSFIYGKLGIERDPITPRINNQ